MIGRPVTLFSGFVSATVIFGFLAMACSAERSHPAAAHPLDPAIQWAMGGLKKIEGVSDYSARLVKRERLGSTLGPHQYIDLKVRHEPFSVYMKFLAPDSVRGREVLYVEGKNDGKLLAHDPGVVFQQFGTIGLKPEGMIAMQGQRYPITDIGIKNLLRQLVDRAHQDRQIPGPCEVTFYEDAKIDGQRVTCIQVVHSERHEKHQFHTARIFVDPDIELPIRYEAYDWPEEEGAKPHLIEEYTYQQLALNQGYTDADFEPKNPAYQFP